jgi:predicted deacetylase
MKYFRYLLLFLTALILFSCESDIYKSDPSLIVILKADDLGNFTPNWERFVQVVQSNDITASIGIIASKVTEHSSVLKIKELATASTSKGESMFEFWNHGYDHVGNKDSTEFSGTTVDYQIDHIRKAQQFFLDSINIQCKTFSSPFNRTTKETYEALKNFPEINVIMTYRKAELIDTGDWLDVANNNLKISNQKIRLHVKFESVLQVPFYKIKKNVKEISGNRYVVIQFHPNNWNEHDFNVFQSMIDTFKKKNAQFMTPQQYYNYLKQNQ